MIYHAHCKACSAKWRTIAPDAALDLVAAVGIMERGVCPTCRNDGSKGPINWKFSFGGDQEPTYAQIRAKQGLVAGKRREA